TGNYTTFHAKATLLATGGSGQVYEHTTNPLVATGDGVAIAYRAGVPISNMEFVQFHPTTLYHPKARAFLITEAMRGEGAKLRNADGEAFMTRYHPLADLAPRDIVARAIVQEIKSSGEHCVYLDATHIPSEHLKSHFPTIYERLLQVGIDITQEPIPVVPAQHYQCGGVVTSLDGAAAIPRLYAAGEVACTGVHGANRLASNSLLEAMVFAYRAANHTLQQANTPLPDTFTPVSQPTGEPPIPISLPLSKILINELAQNIQRAMQNHVGIVRTNAELQSVGAYLKFQLHSLRSLELNSVEAYELRNIAQVAHLIVRSALCRHESRGLHYTLDYPDQREMERQDTVILDGGQS
ncbi:MAG: FAD-binding protein, partial [Armatimonadetes bacterium]|nr:FAD-binding protein [Armatimonadota bacterium]